MRKYKREWLEFDDLSGMGISVEVDEYSIDVEVNGEKTTVTEPCLYIGDGCTVFALNKSQVEELCDLLLHWVRWGRLEIEEEEAKLD